MRLQPVDTSRSMPARGTPLSSVFFAEPNNNEEREPTHDRPPHRTLAGSLGGFACHEGHAKPPSEPRDARLRVNFEANRKPFHKIAVVSKPKLLVHANGRRVVSVHVQSDG